MKKYIPLILAGIILLVSGVMFITAGPLPPQEPPAAEPPAAVQQTVSAPAVYLERPHVTKMKKPVACLLVEGDRYNGLEQNQFKNFPREGVTIYNSCDENIVVIDLKAGTVNTNFAYSILPVRAVITDQRAPDKRERDHYIAFAREGKRCDEKEHAGERACRFIPVPPEHGIFLSMPVKNWFLVKLKDNRVITGYLMAPLPPGEKPKKEVPKMPEKGFKFSHGN